MKLQNLLSALSFQSGHNTVSFSKRWKEIHGSPHYVSGVHAWAQLSALLAENTPSEDI